MEFSLSRFWLLIRKQWVENQKQYLLGVLALTGTMSFIIVWAVTGNAGFQPATQEVLFFSGCILAGISFSSTLLSSYDDKRKSISSFMIPASVLEKFLMALAFSMVFFPLAYVAIAYPLIVMGHYLDVELLGRFNLLSRPDNDKIPSFLFLFFSCQSCALLASVVFRRYTLLKTVVLLCVLFISCFAANTRIAKSVLGDSQPKTLPSTFTDGSIFFPIKEQPRNLVLSEAELFSKNGLTMRSQDYTWKVSLPENKYLIFKAYLVALVGFIWVITFLRLREKQL